MDCNCYDVSLLVSKVKFYEFKIKLMWEECIFVLWWCFLIGLFFVFLVFMGLGGNISLIFILVCLGFIDKVVVWVEGMEFLVVV